MHVHVRVVGQIAQELSDPVSSLTEETQIPSTRCYIESKDNAEYFIEVIVPGQYHIPPSHDTLILATKIDGKQVMSSCFSKKKLSSMPFIHTKHSETTSLAKDGKNLVRNGFIFSPTTTGKTDPVNDDQNTHFIYLIKLMKLRKSVWPERLACWNAGKIVMEVWHAVYCGKADRSKHLKCCREVNLEFAEKSMKRREISHLTRYTVSLITSPCQGMLMS